MEDKIQILREAGIDKILQDKDLRLLFHEVAISIFGENCLNCENKIRDKYAQLLKMNIMEKSELKYKLKPRSEEHTSELQSNSELVCRLLLEKKKKCLINGWKRWWNGWKK
mgnify:CR=1 FL=1